MIRGALVTRVQGGFRFLCEVQGCHLEVEMMLYDDGTEHMTICSEEPRLRLPPEAVVAGTIERCLGPEQWADFLGLRHRRFLREYLYAPALPPLRR